MAESDLGLDAVAMIDRVAVWAGYGTGPTGANGTQVLQWLNDGYRRFLKGKRPDGPGLHVWNFLTPKATITVTAAAATDGRVALPADYGGNVEPFTYTATSSDCPILQMVPLPDMDALWRDSTASGTPSKYAIEPVTGTGTGSGAKQAFKLALWPPPIENRTIQYRYRALPAPLANTASTYTLGGADHCDTIVQFALAAGEWQKLRAAGPEEGMAQKYMMESIELDEQLYGQAPQVSMVRGVYMR